MNMREIEYVPIGRFRVNPGLQLIVSRRKYFKNVSVVIGQFVTNPNDEVLGYFRKNASIQLRLDQFFEFVKWLNDVASRLSEDANLSLSQNQNRKNERQENGRGGGDDK